MSLSKQVIDSDLENQQNTEFRAEPMHTEEEEARVYKRFMGILPAFRHVSSGETHLSCEKDGTLAPVHRVDFLPSQWLNCNIDRSECRLKDCIEKGYVVMGHFFNKEDASHLLPH
jgi:hypothetical protein